MSQGSKRRRGAGRGSGPGLPPATPTTVQQPRRRTGSPSDDTQYEALGIMPGSFLAKFHDACPITASISSALIDLPGIKQLISSKREALGHRVASR